MDFWDYTLLVALIFYILLVIASVYTVLFERRDPTRALIWIVVIVIIPFIGLLLFMFFGQSYRKRKIFNLKELRNLKQLSLLSSWQMNNLENYSDEREVQENIDIVKLLLNNSNTPITLNNELVLLNNGSETFPAIFEALRSATHHIHIEYYILDDGELGNELLEILQEKAKQGVEIRVMFDDVGSWSLSKRYIRKLKASGIEVASFMPVVFPWLTSKANYRNHRKIVVVDGKIGFTGGLNFADRYRDGLSWGVWRDTHLKAEGEIVHMLQATFITDWYSATKKTLNKTANFFPETKKFEKTTACQLALSGPDSDYAAIMQAFFAAMAKAKYYIHISTPYFMPNESVLTALKVAALSGIDVRIMIPAYSDTRIAHWASRSYFTELLEAKVKLYLYEKGLNHSKIMVIDGNFSSVGSANMDTRSFEDNFEVTAMIYNREFAAEIEEKFLEDLNHCKPLTLEGWENRKQKDNFKEAAARLFAPLL